MRKRPCGLVALSILLSGAAPAFSQPAADRYAVVRGMTVSCPMAGQEWGSDEMVQTLGVLADLGVNWVSIHPYGGIRKDGTVGRSRIDSLYDDPYWLLRAIDEAHAKGLRIMIKPHIAYWGTGFSWRGDIAFDDPSEWERFFATYQEWIVKVAGLSTEADAFVVGTELDLTIHHEPQWREIIDAVRATVETPLTYSAGWDRYQDVPFWDALDVIGVQAYFPLVEHEGPATVDEVRAGWGRVVDELESYARTHDRRVVLGELGYNRSRFAAVRPWEYRQESSLAAEALQVQCLDVALDAVGRSDDIVGAFLWKWFPGEYPRGNFMKSAPAMRRVIADHWSAGQ